MEHLRPQSATFRSAEPETVEEFWRTVLGARMLLGRAGYRQGHYRLSSASLGGFSVGCQEAGAGLTGAIDTRATYLAWIPSRGRAVYRRGREEYVSEPDQLFTWRPGVLHEVTEVASSTKITYFALESWRLERHLEKLLDRPVNGPIRLTPTVKLPPGTIRTWWSLIRLAGDILLGDDPGLAHPAVLDPLCEAMMTGLMFSVDHQYRDVLAQPVRRAGSRAVRHAVDAIQAHPERPYTVTLLAELVGTSVRSLQAGFRAELSTSPMAYLRQVRLARAHEILINDSTVTVAQAAHRSGFSHLGRFAAAYTERYGGPPSRIRDVGHGKRR